MIIIIVLHLDDGECHIVGKKHVAFQALGVLVEHHGRGNVGQAINEEEEPGQKSLHTFRGLRVYKLQHCMCECVYAHCVYTKMWKKTTKHQQKKISLCPSLETMVSDSAKE